MIPHRRNIRTGSFQRSCERYFTTPNHGTLDSRKYNIWCKLTRLFALPRPDPETPWSYEGFRCAGWREYLHAPHRCHYPHHIHLSSRSFYHGTEISTHPCWKAYCPHHLYRPRLLYASLPSCHIIVHAYHRGTLRKVPLAVFCNISWSQGVWYVREPLFTYRLKLIYIVHLRHDIFDLRVLTVDSNGPLRRYGRYGLPGLLSFLIQSFICVCPHWVQQCPFWSKNGLSSRVAHYPNASPRRNFDAGTRLHERRALVNWHTRDPISVPDDVCFNIQVPQAGRTARYSAVNIFKTFKSKSRLKVYFHMLGSCAGQWPWPLMWNLDDSLSILTTFFLYVSTKTWCHIMFQ